jgi:hypothetical protein
MYGRSLKVAQENLDRVKASLRRNGFPSQTAFRTESGFARDTIRKFFKGEAIDRLNFEECCRILGLNWK